MTAALGTVLLFGVVSFGAVGGWASAAYQAAALVLYAAGRRIESPPSIALAWAGLAVWGAVQAGFGWTEYRAATELAVLRALAFAALAVCAGRVCSDPGRRAGLLPWVLGVGAAIAILGLVQAATTNRIYWVVEVRAGSPFGPFVNRDHFAVLMEILLPVALWTAVRRRESGWIGWGLTALFFAGAVATGSRAGAAIATVEVLVLGPLAWRVERRGEEFPWRAAAAGLTAIVAAGSLAGWELVAAKFNDGDPLRIRREIWQSAIALIGDRPWVGHGLGTFESVYPSRAVFEANARIDHAHNDWLELAVEGGLPVAALVLASIVVSARRSRDSPWAWGAFAALAHALVDFPMQIPGLAGLMVAMMAGAEVACRHSTSLGVDSLQPWKRGAGTRTASSFCRGRSTC